MQKSSSQIEEVSDQEELEAFMRQDPLVYLYALGDLDPFFRDHCTFFGYRVAGTLEAVALLYEGDALPALLALGGAPTDLLLEGIRGRLPRRFYAHLGLGLCSALEPRFELEVRGHYQRMGLSCPARLDSVDELGTARLLPGDLRAVVELYEAAYPEHWFDPRMLETGRYFGVWEDGDLVAVAGVHVVSEALGVAALGNITTHPRHRRRGLARKVTGALCHDLRGAGVDTVGLNVGEDNAPAKALYASLGFEGRTPYHEVLAVERPGILP